MQKKKENFFDKIVKKDYNNELEKILEKKTFDEDVKSILLNILYKVEVSYKDYKQVKPNILTKEELIEEINNSIYKNCNSIKLLKPSSKEESIIGNHTFLVEKEQKNIICYPVERKLLYCLGKISRQDKIIKENYFLIDETLSDLINVGYNINMVEPLRDFNGYSWTTIPREIESIEHNLIYQNLILLVGNNFMKNWVYNTEFIIDYMEKFILKMQEEYDKDGQRWVELLQQISILLEIKFNEKKKKEILDIKKDIEEKLKEINNNNLFVEKNTKKKKELAKEIKIIDETINNKELLQKEYEKRNENLPLEEKIFSIRILSQQMMKERLEKVEQIKQLNELLNPQKFITYKNELERKEKCLKQVNTKDTQQKIDELKLKAQKIFLNCFEKKLEKAKNKIEMTNLVYEFRYYTMLPYNENHSIGEVEELKEDMERVGKQILQQANNWKVIEKFSKNEEINYLLLGNIFKTRNIKLEEIQIKLQKEKDKAYIQIFDETTLEEKTEVVDKINKKELEIVYNKKIKAFY